MKMWLVVLVAFVALLVTAQNQATPSDTEAADSVMDQGIGRVDSVLQQGLSAKVYDELAAQSKESADWFVDLAAAPANE